MLANYYGNIENALVYSTARLATHALTHPRTYTLIHSCTHAHMHSNFLPLVNSRAHIAITVQHICFAKHSSIHPSIWPSIHLSIPAPIQPNLPIASITHLSIYPSLHLFPCPACQQIKYSSPDLRRHNLNGKLRLCLHSSRDP